MKTVIIKGAAAIDKAIASIKNRGAKLDASIQQAGVSVLAHASEHGDTTCADRLVAAMPKGARKLALVEWMLAFGQVRLLDKAKPEEVERIKAGAVFKLDRERKLNLDGADEMRWHEFKKEAAVNTAFDAQAAVANVLARMRGAVAKGMSIEHKEQALKDAQSLVAMLSEDAE